MSASIYASPLQRRVPVQGGGSRLWEVTQRIFGDTPVMDSHHLAIVRALAEANPNDAEYWRRIGDLIESHGPVRLEAEY